jgi:hypothetical protein
VGDDVEDETEDAEVFLLALSQRILDLGLCA